MDGKTKIIWLWALEKKLLNLKKTLPAGRQVKDMPRSRIDSLTEFVKSQGLGGLCYFKVENNKLEGPIAKFFNEDEKDNISKKMKAESGDILFIAAGEYRLTNEVLARLRQKLAEEEGLIDKGRYDFLWVTEFPLFKYNDEEKRWESEHHPFTAPYDEDMKYFDSDLSKIRARSYDIVLNGVELGSGSIRIHRTDMQSRIFNAIGIDKKEAEERFGFLKPTTELLSAGIWPFASLEMR